MIWHSVHPRFWSLSRNAAVAKGEIEMQIGQITEITIAPGVDLAGPFPGEIQNTILMAAGIVATGKAPDAATLWPFQEQISRPRRTKGGVIKLPRFVISQQRNLSR
jgi:hypothetical protein